ASLVAREFIGAFSITIARAAYLRNILQRTRVLSSRRCNKFFIENHSLNWNIFVGYPVLVIAVRETQKGQHENAFASKELRLRWGDRHPPR
ncbi:MAG: hypothetical protein WBE25_14290, partial [Xanthobacteraceae bacterium]